MIASLNLGDATVAAVIAAVASMVNAYMLAKARGTQKEIKEEVVQVKRYSEIRDKQIEELRSLSVTRIGHISALERIADRLEALGDDIPDATRKRVNLLIEQIVKTAVKDAVKEAMSERASEHKRDRSSDT